MRGEDATRPLGTPTAEQLLNRLEWHVVRRLDGILQGNYRTVFRGAGLDFLDLREYEPGDDVRHIDWNVTARMDTLFVRQYAEERELTAWLLLDRSRSMGFGPIDRPKELVLCELATTFARLLTRGGNRVGAILFDNEVSVWDPTTAKPLSPADHTVQVVFTKPMQRVDVYRPSRLDQPIEERRLDTRARSGVGTIVRGHVAKPTPRERCPGPRPTPRTPGRDPTS